MRRVCLIIATLVAMGCGSGNTNGGNPSSNGGATGQQCVSPNCIACVEQYCDAQAVAVFGSEYAPGNYNGGQCPNLMTCACAASGTVSMAFCAQQGGANCVTAFGSFSSCINAAPCVAACTGNGGNGGSTGTGGTTPPSTGLACPLGTWTADLGVLCGTTNAYGVAVVTEIVAGRYSVTMTVGPMPGRSQDSCEMSTIVSLSATYANGVLIYTFNPDPDTCPNKLATATATINADCTQWRGKTDFAGCETCDVTGMCSGCGSMNCPSTGPGSIAVRSP